jgi:hypothetical protein
MKRALAALAALAMLSLAGCASEPADNGAARISDALPLGAEYESPVGNLIVISVQDEYRLIRVVSVGPIGRSYEDLFAVPRDAVKFNRWMPVKSSPGLELAIVSPTEVAFRFGEAGGYSK